MNIKSLILNLMSMADTTIPTPQDNTQAQDLQINLDLGEPTKKILQGGNAPKTETPELDLDLNLDFSDAPKDDDRLKTEDKANNEAATTPVIEPVITPIVEPIVQEPIIEQLIPEIKKQEVPEPIMSEPIIESKHEEPIEQIPEPSTMIESEAVPIAATAELKNDMRIIEELE